MSDSGKTTEEKVCINLKIVNDLIKKTDIIKHKIDRIRKKVDDLDKRSFGFVHITNAKVEIILRKISANSAAFDRLEAKFHENRSEFLHFRADMKDMHEDIYLWKKEATKETMELS